MTLGYGNYTMQEISSAPGYAFVVPQAPNFGVNGVPVPAVGNMPQKATTPVPTYVPQKDNTGNYILAGAAATAAIVLGILALKKGKKPAVKPSPAKNPAPKSIEPPPKAEIKPVSGESKKPLSEEKKLGFFGRWKARRAAKKQAKIGQKNAKKQAAYSTHVTMDGDKLVISQPTKVRPDLQKLKDYILVSADRAVKEAASTQLAIMRATTHESQQAKINKLKGKMNEAKENLKNLFPKRTVADAPTPPIRGNKLKTSDIPIQFKSERDLQRAWLLKQYGTPKSPTVKDFMPKEYTLKQLPYIEK